MLLKQGKFSVSLISRLLLFHTLALIILLITGCKTDFGDIFTKAHDVCETLTFCDPTAKTAIRADVVCHSSIGSSCNQTTLNQTINTVGNELAARPGSHLAIWGASGGTVDAIGVVAEATVPTNGGGDLKSLGAKASVLFKRKPYEWSPLIETINQISSTSTALPRVIILISSGTERSAIANFRCWTPTLATFKAEAKKAQVFHQGMLTGIKVMFLFAKLGAEHAPVRGGGLCVPTVKKQRQIQRLWLDALTYAGATTVSFSPDGVLPSAWLPETKEGGISQ